MKKALCIGISSFENNTLSYLPGCINDAKRMSQVLKEHYGFKTGGTRLLTDNDATKGAILEYLNWLTSGLSADDVIVLTVSTHGTWYVERNGTENPDMELDGRKEAIAPYDYSKTNVILDDEITQRFEALPDGVRCYCIIDTCHSGTMASNNLCSRYVPPSVDVLNRLPDNGNGWKSQQFTGCNNNKWISISACKDDQEAVGIQTAYGHYGLMTLALIKALENQHWQGTANSIFNEMNSLMSNVTNFVSVEQTPELHGNNQLKEHPLFR